MVVIFSITVTLITFEILLRLLETRHNNFETNLSVDEISQLNIRTFGIIDQDYYNRVALMPWHTKNDTWMWPGQKNREVEFFIKGSWNNFGCNDVDFSIVNEIELFVGDSFVESLQVPIEKSFFNILRKNSHTAKNVYGCGVSGWSVDDIYYNLTGKSLSSLEKSLGLLNLKHVHVVSYLGNDVKDILPKNTLQDNECKTYSKYKSFYLLQRVYRMYFSKELVNCIKPMLFAYDVEDENLLTAVELYIQNLEDLSNFLKENQIEMSLYLIPPLALYQVKNLSLIDKNFFNQTDYAKYISALDDTFLKARIVELSILQNFQVFDLTPVLDKNDYYESDGHLNVNGHAKFANFLAKSQN